MEKLIEAIVSTFQGYRGFDDWWNNLDKEIKVTIKVEIAGKIYDAGMQFFKESNDPVSR